MARRDEEPAEALAAFAVVVDEVVVAGDVEQALWFGAPAVKVGGKMFVALRRGALIARLGADEVDARVAAGDGVRFDPSGKGRPMKDWLESNVAHAEWVELALAALAFTAGD
ncbi:hypothetical protein DSM104299_03550 [Baekduia alba]|uniref:hypothetical protein n=1 Tax=Baekduia alba TaxID=2997333 RepID=UPI002341CE74|nr:hypothetical protein [Baekduia alba]WCB94811.1 hypothetical protein DSM104299_03550 [Baekduia alba]